MGKRKSRSSKSMVAPKKPPKLDTEFACPFCGLPDAVGCLIDLKHRFARASCRICQESYATRANALTVPVDVYSEWIDACVDANEGVAHRRCRPRLADAGVHEDDV
ncbi:transcription elongation factor 1 homolog [Panicum virgatum]|uniref:Transcription elongation factor 1 homolog n=1 Tax=Panicum virgatum TaxID=38727 RepID=A0A8T0T7N0_PANVG|nr:transcription elongation factor 1 homolog [Panicum virgatum]KAG2604386.1 hypothetical protein PVAP13_4NG058598 [Panicum virgatum]